MTRAERRRVERENRKQPTYNLSRDQLREIKQEATHDAAETAFLMIDVYKRQCRYYAGTTLPSEFIG